jgi:hypothetical protein
VARGCHGAKLARPEDVHRLYGQCVFGMVGMDFETAVQENIPIGSFEERLPAELVPSLPPSTSI